MTNFKKNLAYLMLASGCKTDGEFARDVGLQRYEINKIKNGVREPTEKQKLLIANRYGIDIADMDVSDVKFKRIIDLKFPHKSHMAYFLKTIEINLPRCKEVFYRYQGQFIVYTNRSKEGTVVASLLNIKRLTKNGIEFEMINPYKEGDLYDAYIYRGFMMPVGEFLYFVCEQNEQTYEVLTMMFHAVGTPEPRLLRGAWLGVGVKDGMKAIASVSAVASRQLRPIEDWREAIPKKLGHVKVGSLDQIIQTQLNDERVVVPG